MARGKESDITKLEKAWEQERQLNEEIFQALSFSDADKQKAVEKVIKDVEDDEKNRKPYLDGVVEVLDLYEGKVQKAPAFTGAANVSTRVVTMVVEILHSILFPAVWNEDLHYWTPTESTDIAQAAAVSKWMKWDASRNKLKLLINDWVKWIILEGTQVSKTRWDEKWKWVQKKVPDAPGMMKAMKKVLLNLAKGKQEFDVDVQPYKIEYEPMKREMVATDLINLEDVGFPTHCNPTMDVEDLEHIWHRYPKFIHELQEMEDRGFIAHGSTAKIGAAIEKGIVGGKEQGTAKQRMDAEGSRAVDIEKGCTPVKIVEWYGKWLCGGKWQEIVLWIDTTTKTYLAGTYLRYIDKFEKRPFRISQLIRRKGRMYGISIGELVKEYQKILDEMQNQNLNAGKLATQPPGFYRAASGYDPEQVVLQPGIMIPVDDINDVRWFQIPATTLPSHEEMRLILEMVEKIASIGSYQSGQESNIVRTRATARGTMAVIQQGERRFFVLGMSLQSHLAEMMQDRLRYYQQYLSSDMAERVLGPDGQALFPEGLGAADLAGEFDLQMSLDATGGSKSQKQEFASMIYQNYMANPLVQQDPGRVWEVSARPLREIDEVDIESILGPKPQQQAIQGGAQGIASPSPQPAAGQAVAPPAVAQGEEVPQEGAGQ